ncbi:phosphoglycerate kinase [Cryobacterium sp. TMT1-21]|uniref:Phosphoglycerate kinase n=1 Tax=Cryobacterium shii TaxID=1259235 RepID=A0AAQ2HFQ9_9MICO|nr:MULTISPECIES: phosphoglycerate kinase [Cryobacterium]TFC49106.1 phosphoglycerate kinase [Cryobacterium shii]TFC83596.1 phosphoglycerate kinase [Cryobacterium sp. TmT2-59]TFD16070.1 phosphoglycerate kinase [Cryobacterium sp. TMT1-21]TFD22027.1 phosphoglycerate kinase [Cryobacterium sp. TMT4-10]TFD28212.1 phosphoglycerate kinase [Cryobacterium sp. TMT2-23]
MTLRTIESLGQLSGKRVIVRCDLNVPLKDGEITDDGRVRASLPTIKALREQGARVVIVSHLGRPKGAPEARYSLAPVAVRLAELLGADVAFATDTVGASAQAAVAALADGEVVVLENLRFNAGETAKDDAERGAFATELSALGDVLVSDGFGVVHRKQASVFDLAGILPSAAGLLIAAELEVLDRLTEKPEAPYAVVLGGSKVSDKLGVIGHLLPRVNSLLIGGGMAYTFLAAQGHKVGASLLEADQIETVRGYLQEAERLGVKIVVPTDVVVASKFGADAEIAVTPASGIEDTTFGASGLGLDIGPETAAAFADIIRASKTVFWNGPMGVFELAPFAEGTRTVAAALTEVDGLSVVGGGDSAAAVRTLGFTDDQFGHISTGGGASLEFLEGKRLPGLEVLGWQ